MVVKNDWSFKELVDNIKRLKEEYDFFLAFFYFNYETYKKSNEYKKRIRDMFYKVNIKEWQIDLCWEYMNDYRSYYELVEVVRKIDRKK